MLHLLHWSWAAHKFNLTTKERHQKLRVESEKIADWISRYNFVVFRASGHRELCVSPQRTEKREKYQVSIVI